MPSVDPMQSRHDAVQAMIARIREIAPKPEVTREDLERIKPVLAELASRTELFPEDSFTVAPGTHGAIYELATDVDRRYALYASAGVGGKAQPPHNHTTWAVIVGVSGEELNRFYDRTPDNGVSEKGQHVVRQGAGVSFMPDDLHSIHIDGPLLNFHMYGLGLEQLARREYYKPDENAWAIFPPHTDIREARASHP